MKGGFLAFIICAAIATVFYFVGKLKGESATKIMLTENVETVKMIAELAALDVVGNLNLKISNKGEERNTWAKIKNYLSENTLQVNVPFEAKFGVVLKDQKLKIDTKKNSIVVYLPHCKLLSMQLKVDKMETMTQTGIFASASMDDLLAAQKQLYTQALQKVEGSPAYIGLAEKHVSEIMTDYYKPMGYTVQCIFIEAKEANVKD